MFTVTAPATPPFPESTNCLKTDIVLTKIFRLLSTFMVLHSMYVWWRNVPWEATSDLLVEMSFEKLLLDRPTLKHVVQAL
jgi:hypothetical protein